MPDSELTAKTQSFREGSPTVFPLCASSFQRTSKEHDFESGFFKMSASTTHFDVTGVKKTGPINPESLGFHSDASNKPFLRFSGFLAGKLML